MAKSVDFHLALLAYRSSPLDNGYSPAELLMGRKLRSTVPVLPQVLKPETPLSGAIRERESARQARNKANYDSRHQAIQLPLLSPGDPVWVRDLDRFGKVDGPMAGAPRSYAVRTDKGTVRRNRQALVNMPVEESCDSGQQVNPAIPTLTSQSSATPHMEQRERIDEHLDRQTDTTQTCIQIPHQQTTFTRSGRVSKPPVKLNL